VSLPDTLQSIFTGPNFIGDSPAPRKIYPVFPEHGFTFYVRGFVVADTPDIGITEKRAQSY
jgi:hypothetical protein